MARRRWKQMPEKTRREVIRLGALGKSAREIGHAVGYDAVTVYRKLAPYGGVHRAEQWQTSEARLSLDERVEIRLGIGAGESCRSIAGRLGRAPSTVTRELARNGGASAYRPLHAHRRAEREARRPKPTKLATHPELCRRVTTDLEALWSPEQIRLRLRTDFGDDPVMSISHETIYKSLYVQGRGELRRELARCLRSGRAARRHQGRIDTRGLRDMVLISERPAEVADRAVPGHWEGDLIMGANNASAIGTLVERSTRFVMLLHLPKGKTAADVRHAMTSKILELPEALRRSITWDRGREMAEHVQFTVDTGVQIYFCDPHSPWQRGSNENTNGLLRQYFPKGTSLRRYSEDDLRAAADSLNGRPRETLGGMTPSEKLAELVALTG